MTLEDLQNLVKDARSPKEIFGDDIDKRLRDFSAICHPDRNPGNPVAEQLFKDLHNLATEAKKPSVKVKSPKRTYSLLKMLASGDVSDLFLAECKDKEYVLKISRVDGVTSLLDNERKTLASLLRSSEDLLKKVKRASYGKYLPTLVESFPAKQGFLKRVNVFTYRKGLYTLKEVLEKYPTGISDKHLAWMFKRILEILGFIHSNGYVHGGILPSHVMIHADEHGLQLAGWIHAVKIGEKIDSVSSEYKNWYPTEIKNKKPVSPATDIYMAALCAKYLVGGDLEKLPDPMKRFFISCLLEGQSMRPDNAWDLHDEFSDILKKLFGPPKFVHFHMV